MNICQALLFVSANVRGTCGGKFDGKAGGIIASPGFPNASYPPNANCQYEIVAPKNNIIVVCRHFFL